MCALYCSYRSDLYTELHIKIFLSIFDVFFFICNFILIFMPKIGEIVHLKTNHVAHLQGMFPYFVYFSLKPNYKVDIVNSMLQRRKLWLGQAQALD